MPGIVTRVKHHQIDAAGGALLGTIEQGDDLCFDSRIRPEWLRFASVVSDDANNSPELCFRASRDDDAIPLTRETTR